MNRIVSFIFAALILTLMACRTTDRTSDIQATHQADTLSVVHAQEGRVGDTLSRQTFNQWFSEQWQQHNIQSTETETEQTVEEITTTTDTLGNTTRTERRSTTRAQASQNTQSQQSQQTDYSSVLDALQQRIDALSQEMVYVSASTKSDNISEATEKTSSPSLTWRVLTVLSIILDAIIIAGAVYLYKKVKS